MANYRWTDYADRSFQNRYPKDTIGFEVWRDLPRAGDFISRDFDFLARFDQVPKRKYRKPRVFISHRQADADYAERIAYLACKQGFEYWLDIHDLNPPNSLNSGVAIASIIEMALLNCSHVLAVYTSNTKGSEWVPYEYGRVKIHQLSSSNIACWIHNQASGANKYIPEYFDLGMKTWNEKEINNWLSSELASFQNRNVIPSCTWNHPIPMPLP